MENLRECPFCESKNITVFEASPLKDFGSKSILVGMSFMECMRCHAQGPTGKGIKDATENWNTRSHESSFGNNWWNPTVR